MIRVGTTKFLPGVVMHAAAALFIAAAAHAADWKPERAVELVAMSGPGGANDVIARTLQRVMQQKKLVEAPLTVVSKVGAGGVIAWNYLNQHAGDGGYISVSPINLLIEHILGASPITYTDVTPIAQLFNEYVAFAVKADSRKIDLSGRLFLRYPIETSMDECQRPARRGRDQKLWASHRRDRL